jgi:hypothetical protein
MLEACRKKALPCFIKNYLLRTKIKQHGERRTVLVVLDSLITQLLEGIHGDMLYDHKGQFKTKERVLHSCWCKGMGQDINGFLEKCDKCQKTKKLTREKISHYAHNQISTWTKELTNIMYFSRGAQKGQMNKAK